MRSNRINIAIIYEKKKRKYSKTHSLSIQILQYEFLGPIPLDQWGPPMEKVVFLIMSRDQDKFNITYAGDCEKTTESTFFTNHPNFKCWIKKSISEKSLYLAILPLFESDKEYRENILKKIKTRYKPVCNSDESIKTKPDYIVRNSEKISCPNCDAEMKLEKVFEKATQYKCNSCGSNYTKPNS